MWFRKTMGMVLGVACLLLGSPGLAWSAEAAEKGKKQAGADARFLRVARDAKARPTALEAAIVSFAPADRQRSSPTVDLVAAVHIAESGFYDQLNKEFQQYDVVLYEMVAPEGTKPPKGGDGKSTNPLSAVQNGLTDLLELEFQLKGIDYTRKNFVHADMSPEEFAQSMRDRDESVVSIMLRMMGYAMAQEGKKTKGSGGDFDVLMAFLDKDRAMALKRIMAQQFEELGDVTAVLDGPTGSTLISERNKRVIEVLRREVGAGKKRIAIFYGAGHMPDLEKRLEADFGLVRGQTRWLKAWELEEKPRANKAKPRAAASRLLPSNP